jgi:hypothetical protein
MWGKTMNEGKRKLLIDLFAEILGEEDGKA